MPPRRVDRRRARTLLRWLALALCAAGALCAVGFLYLRFFPPLTTMVQIQRRIESVIRRTHYEKRYTFVPLARISPHLPHAVVAAEDARFFEHHGIDWHALRRALRDNWRRKRLWRGGSTITQQLVKNLFLVTYRMPGRKLVELPLALLAELILNKQRILELYLNVVEWGPGVYGAEAAAAYHYNTNASTLSRTQSARLAVCLPSPRGRRAENMHRLGAMVERRMTIRGW